MMCMYIFCVMCFMPSNLTCVHALPWPCCGNSPPLFMFVSFHPLDVLASVPRHDSSDYRGRVSSWLEYTRVFLPAAHHFMKVYIFSCAVYCLCAICSLQIDVYDVGSIQMLLDITAEGTQVHVHVYCIATVIRDEFLVFYFTWPLSTNMKLYT